MNTSPPESTPCGATPNYGGIAERRAEFPCTLPAGHDGRHHRDIADGALDWDEWQTDYKVKLGPVTPEHDELCEKLRYAASRECRCADRRDVAGIDSTLLKMRVKRVRQATEALEKVKHTLASYVSGHAPTHCEHAFDLKNCGRAVDGFLLLSCGHYGFLCAEHGSQTLRAVQGGSIDCTKSEPLLHIRTARGVTLEWMGLA